MKFGVGVKIIDNSLIISFDSKTKLDLLIKNVKLFYENDSIKEDKTVVPIFLDNGKTDSFSLRVSDDLKIRTVTFIVKDNINKEQYAISNCMKTNKITMTEMLYNS